MTGVNAARYERYRTQTRGITRNFMQQAISLSLVKKHSYHWARFIVSCKNRLNVFRCTMINYVDTFSPKSELILPQWWKFLPPDVEISSPRPLFRNYTNSIVKLDLIYTHPIADHQILWISYPYQKFSIFTWPLLSGFLISKFLDVQKVGWIWMSLVYCRYWIYHKCWVTVTNSRRY